jgi:hypothetical protein
MTAQVDGYRVYRPSVKRTPYYFRGIAPAVLAFLGLGIFHGTWWQVVTWTLIFLHGARVIVATYTTMNSWFVVRPEALVFVDALSLSAVRWENIRQILIR